jgi:hypothetical protein
VSLSSGYQQIYSKAPWPLEEGILEEVKKDQNIKGCMKWFVPVVERKLRWRCHRLLAKSFSVSIAIKNNEVINQIPLKQNRKTAV